MPAATMVPPPERGRRHKALPGVAASLVDRREFREGTSFLQSRLWATQKEAFGWQGHTLRFTTGEPERGFDLLVLTKALRAGFHLAYVPHGPALADLDRLLPLVPPGLLVRRGFSARGHILGVVGQLVKEVLGLRLTAVRFDLDWELPAGPAAPAASGRTASQAVAKAAAGDEADDAAGGEDLAADAVPDPEALRRLQRLPPLCKAPADIQPPDTVLVDLQGSEAEVLGRMKSKTRYNVRLSAKKGVQIRTGSLQDLDTWYELYLQTARRDRISIHGREYYRRLLADNPDTTCLLLASDEGEDLAGIFILFHGALGTYLYGASSNNKRNLMPAYGLQWEGMRLARSRGCVAWDLFGIPPSADPAHPMHGLYQVKTGYGGRIVHRYGTWDLVTAPLAYHAFRWYEQIRFYVLRTLRKRLG